MLSANMTRARIVLTATESTVSVSVVADVPEAARHIIASTPDVRLDSAGELTWMDLDMPLHGSRQPVERDPSGAHRTKTTPRVHRTTS